MITNTMKLATKIVRPCYMLQCSNQFCSTSRPKKVGPNHLSLKIKNSWNSKRKTTDSCQFLVSRAVKLPDKWMEFQGIKNWEGLLDPLDDSLRDEILRYGQFVEATYRCFNFDTSSPEYAMCLYPKSLMLTKCGLTKTGYKVTKSLHSACGIHLTDWAHKIPSWISIRSSWIGYIAVCNDKNEIARLGRRDVVIAYRGTATCMEWLENLRATLTCLPTDMSSDNGGCMVQSGFWSLYTSNVGKCPSLRGSIQEEISKILQKYADEPLSITVTGHSLGAALATLTAYDITTTFKNAPLVTVVSFGGPRVGNRHFRRQLESNGTKVLRIVNSDDPVTKVPGFVLEEDSTQLSQWLRKRVEETQWVYAEIGKELRLSSRDCPHLSNRGLATCHDLKTYLHLVDNFVSSNCPIRAKAKSVLNRA